MALLRRDLFFDQKKRERERTEISDIYVSETLIEREKKVALRVGFEPTRENPSDFESDALTTRPSQLATKFI